MKRITGFFSYILKKKRKLSNDPNFPLTSVIISPSTLIDIYEDMARDFIGRIIELQYKCVFLTDMSSLWDFSCLFGFETYEETRDHLLKKIVSIYGVDVSDIGDGNLVKIFERLA